MTGLDRLVSLTDSYVVRVEEVPEVAPGTIGAILTFEGEQATSLSPLKEKVVRLKDLEDRLTGAIYDETQNKIIAVLKMALVIGAMVASYLLLHPVFALPLNLGILFVASKYGSIDEAFGKITKLKEERDHLRRETFNAYQAAKAYFPQHGSDVAEKIEAHAQAVRADYLTLTRVNMLLPPLSETKKAYLDYEQGLVAARQDIQKATAYFSRLPNN